MDGNGDLYSAILILYASLTLLQEISSKTTMRYSMYAKDLVEILSEVHDDCLVTHSQYSLRFERFKDRYWFYRVTVYESSGISCIKCRYVDDNGISCYLMYYDGRWVNES